MQRGRVIAMAVIALACTVGAIAFVAIAASSGDGTATKTKARLAPEGQSWTGSSGSRPGELLVRAVDSEDTGLDGKLTVASLGGSKRPKVASLACQRVHMTARIGVCLALAPTAVDYEAIIFDRAFSEGQHLSLNGLPSRVRVAPNGRLAAVTAFVTGHSYAVAGQFSTSTRLLDLTDGKWIADLEDFRIYRNGVRVTSADVNLWGVTFLPDSRSFYATLATGSYHYLVRGDVRARRVDVVPGTDNVECPSLSPDGTRIGYKRTLGDGHWRLSVMNLRTGATHELAERRSIDDQVEWLDNDWITYGDGQDVWATRADGSGRPHRLLTSADSPTVVR